ncbi:hypothetical protein FRC07_002988, partial [Ceratobasidium sp. 392]
MSSKTDFLRIQFRLGTTDVCFRPGFQDISGFVCLLIETDRSNRGTWDMFISLAPSKSPVLNYVESPLPTVATSSVILTFVTMMSMLFVMMCAVLVTVVAMFVSFGFADVVEFVCVLFKHLNNKVIVVVVSPVAGLVVGPSLLLTLYSWVLVPLKDWSLSSIGLCIRWLVVRIRSAMDRFESYVVSLNEPGDVEGECSQTTDDTFLSSADLGRTKVSSPGPQRKVEEPVAPFKRGTARKFKNRTGFDGVNRRRLREQKARRVISPVIEEPKRHRAEPDAGPTAEAPSVAQGEDQNNEATISGEEVAEVPPSPNTSSTTLETTVATLETSFASLETAPATPDTSLDTSYTKEGEVAEVSEEVGQAEENEENEEVGEIEGGEGEGGRDTESTVPESNQVSTFGGEGSVPALNEEPSTVLAGDSIPAPADILASTDAVPAISEAPAVMEAARMAEESRVVEQEQAPIANKESSNVAHGGPAASTATADTPGTMGDLPRSATPSALEPRKQPSDEFEGERKKSEGLEEGEEGEEGKESEGVKESEEIEGEEENNRDVGSGVAESNQVSTSAVEDSVPVPNEESDTLPAGNSVPVPVNMPASTDATAAVTGAPAVTEAAQTAEQDQVVAQEE